ncbi:hypothetical protein QA635_34280 [Bradyrhizobium brasilense]|uniref:hypothetical protein n=1 Tax=Bradyrhizobium brasilense TaxID=1419277 RepID=UPI0024B1A31F|nr:hypothetical protein [Bradyrhizobium australafricanum]WFU31543.1 hypothetical protein QA635_34280 [Bradyrhizobium australafricanum]
MTGIGLPGEPHIGAAGADSTSGSSSSRSESGVIPAEGSQVFDVVVERMRSAPEDETAVLTSQPSGSGVTVPISSGGEGIEPAMRKMNSLLVELDTCRNAAVNAQNSPEEQELIDRFVKAGSAVLDYYANLPSHVARSILSDDQAHRLRDETLEAADQCNALGTPTTYALEGSRKNAGKVLERIRQSNAPPEQLIRAASSVAKHYLACVEWWGKKALRSERMQSICAATANLPSTTAEMRQAEQAAVRLHTGWALFTKNMHLQSQVALARVMIESQASTFEPAVRQILLGENGRARLLGTFIEDVVPAFLSTGDAVLNSKGRVLDAEHCTVLEGVMERLSEFASALHDMVAELRNVGAGGNLPLELLDQIEEAAWVTAHEIMGLLALQPKMPAIIAPLTEAGAALPVNTTGRAAVAEGTAARRKGKGKRRPAAGAGSSAVGRPELQPSGPGADTAPAAKVIVLSDLGTKKLATAEEAHARASSSATEHLAMWRAPPSKEALTRLLQRLDELLQFDLAGQQRAISQARHMKPEDADHVVHTVVERLQNQAAEIEACVAALQEPRRRGLLTPVQVPEVHDKIVRLKAMLSEVQGQANALKARKAMIKIDCMKTYAFPSQQYLERLQAAKELAPLEPPRALKGEPGTLFEIKLQPKALGNGAMPSPMWVHIHTKRPGYAWQLAALDDAEFAACHVKSNEQRGYNRLWQNARAAMGHEDVVIHRGKLTPAFCKSLLSTVDGQSWYPRLEAEFGAMQLARHGM